MFMRKPKHHHSLSSTYVPPKPRKTSVQKLLFEASDDDSIPPVPVITEDEKKEIECESCKKLIVYSVNDLHPGIVCQGCGHGQANPNLKGRNWP